MKDFILRAWRKEDAEWYVNDYISNAGKNQFVNLSIYCILILLLLYFKSYIFR